MVGLPDASVRESRERVQSAIRNSGFDFPRRHVTVNLSPADIRKVGSAFDLPIALGVLAATGLIQTRQIDDAVVLGELSLDGAVQLVRGVLPISARARRDGVCCVILPSANTGGAALVEGLEVTAIYSVAGLLPPGAGVLTAPPFRAPHHTASDVALVGGGTIPRPGEISLARNGVLLLDETAEFARHALDALRQPLEEGTIRIARAARTAVFPARFMLAATMNPCPCGYLGDSSRACRCTPQQVDRYRDRLSGPIRDRIDLSGACAGGAVPDADRGGPRRVLRLRAPAGRRGATPTDRARRPPRHAAQRADRRSRTDAPVRARPGRPAGPRRCQPPVSSVSAQLSPADEGRPHDRGSRWRGTDRRRACGRGGAVSVGGVTDPVHPLQVCLPLGGFPLRPDAPERRPTT